MYGINDVIKMTEAFSNISENRDNPEKCMEELEKLVDYPENVLKEFLQSINAIGENLTGKDKFDEEYLKENYYGILGYIAIRLNLV